VLLGDGFELAEDLEVTVRKHLLAARAPGAEAGVGAGLFAGTVLAGKEAAGEREIGEDAEAVCARGRDDFALDATVEKVVLVLGGDERVDRGRGGSRR
jgi:hypothetical protein